MKNIYVTYSGYSKLTKKLYRLQTIEVPEVRKALKLAREFGDFSENAELDAAKEKNQLLQTEINRLENLIPMLSVPEYKDHSPYVRFDAYVTWQNLNSNETIYYRIVGSEEIDNMSEGMISMDSPLARASFGKKINDQINVNTPEGIQILSILNVEYKKDIINK